MRKILLLITSAIFLFGCSKPMVAEVAVVNEVKKNSIIIENWGGEITEVDISSTNDFTFEENKEYYFRYEIHKNKKAVLISAESSEN